MAQKYGMQLSHGVTDWAYDNAAMESFFHTFKKKLVYFKKYQTIEKATLDIFAYIYTFYNSKKETGNFEISITEPIRTKLSIKTNHFGSYFLEKYSKIGI